MNLSGFIRVASKKGIIPGVKIALRKRRRRRIAIAAAARRPAYPQVFKTEEPIEFVTDFTRDARYILGELTKGKQANTLN